MLTNFDCVLDFLDFKKWWDFDDFKWINNRCNSLKQRDAELEKSENLKCEGGVKTSPTQVSKVYLMGRSKEKENLIAKGAFKSEDTEEFFHCQNK